MNKLIKKITANNGGIFTGKGTNTYLIGNEDIKIIVVEILHITGPTARQHRA